MWSSRVCQSKIYALTVAWKNWLTEKGLPWIYFIFDQPDSKLEGQMQFISSQEGWPIDHNIPLARDVLDQLPKFPALIVPSNEIWNILDKIFVLIHVQSWLHTLTAIQQFQWYAVVFQNVLVSNRCVVEEAKQIPLNCNESLLWTKKQLAIFITVAERSSWLTYAQQELEWSLQLKDCLMVATKPLTWPLLPVLKGALMGVKFNRSEPRLLWSK